MATIKLTGFNTATGRSSTAGDNDTVDLDGSLTLGNNADDAVVFNAEIDSHFIPDDDATYDIGSASKKWRNGYFDQINAKQRDVKVVFYNSNDASQKFIRFSNTGVAGNSNATVNSILVAPADGSLLSLAIRTTSAAGSTSIAFHKDTDGTSLPISGWSSTETQVIDISSANTTYQAVFGSSTFNGGDILGISITPTNTPNDVNITVVWLFDWNT